MQQNWKQNTAVFLGGQIVSLFGSALVQYAISWHITITTGSGIYLTLAIICGFLPTFLLSPFAGVWADRYSRKTLIILADGSIALATLILAISIMLGYDAIWPLFVALGIRALGSAVQSPCISAMLPQIVPAEHLTRVNGINTTAQSIITLGAPALSALLLSAAPFASIFLIDVVTAAIAIVILLAFFKLPKSGSSNPDAPADYFGQLKSGVRYVLDSKYLKSFFLYIAIVNLLFAPVAFLTPLQTTRNYGSSEYYLMAIEMAFSVGMIAGGITIAAWGGFKNRVHTMIAAILVMAGLCVVLGLTIPFPVYLAAMALFGIAMTICNTPAMVMLQEKVDPDYMGRVFGVLTMINTSMMPIGMLIFGPLADVIRIEWMLISTGVILFVMALIFGRDKELLKAGDTQA